MENIFLNKEFLRFARIKRSKFNKIVVWFLKYILRINLRKMKIFKILLLLKITMKHKNSKKIISCNKIYKNQ